MESLFTSSGKNTVLIFILVKLSLLSYPVQSISETLANTSMQLSEYSNDNTKKTGSIATILNPLLFTKISRLSGKGNYYTIITDSSDCSIIRADYNPPTKPVKLGYQIPYDVTPVHTVSWDWRLITPPSGSSEKTKKRNDSGASVYLIFKEKMCTMIIKYVYSETLPVGTVIRKDPLYPVQRMFLVVSNSLLSSTPGSWMRVSINVAADYKRLYNTGQAPPLKGIGLMSDGDETKSHVVADYKNITIY